MKLHINSAHKRLIGRNEKVKTQRHLGNLPMDDLLRPEPKPAEADSPAGGLALLGIAMAAIALVVIYSSTPIDAPEWPDCPIQSLGSCGEK